MSLIQIVSKDIRKNPKRLLLFSSPKVGKTTAVSGLPDSLIIDLEDGSNYISGHIVNVLKIAGDKLGISPKEVLNSPNGAETCLSILKELIPQIRDKYKYVVIDSVTALVKIATWLGTQMYKASVQGKNYTGDDIVRDGANGAGYEWLRQAYEKILSSIEPLATECAIEIAHVKDASIMKDGRDMSARDIQLPGKLKYILCQNADAIGFMFRRDGTNTIVSFKNDERDLATGARPAHLNNQEFVLVEEAPKGSRQFTYHWSKIFID